MSAVIPGSRLCAPPAPAAAASGRQAAAVRRLPRALRLAAVRRAWPTQLGANPAEALIRSTGDWVLRFLCITLAITPLRESLEAADPGSLSPHARPVRLLLRGAAFPLLRLARHGPRPGCDRGRHSQAPVCAGRLPRPVADGAAGGDLVQPCHQGPGRADAGRCCTRRSTRSCCWGCCTSSGCGRPRHNFAEVAVYAAVIALLLGWRLWRHFGPARAAR